MLKQLAVAMLQLATVALPLWVVLRVVLARRRGAYDARREAVLLAWMFCAMAIAAITVMPLPIAHRGRPLPDLWNPLRSFSCLTPVPGELADAGHYCARNVFGNVVLFLPVGAGVRTLARTPTLTRALVVGACLSIAIETTQLMQGAFGIYRQFDTADVLLNTVGALLGYALAWALVTKRRNGVAQPSE